MPSIWIIIYILLNIFAFILMGADKQKAKTNKRRIPEKHLFFYAVIGGSVGIWLAMKVFRHKTKHPSFQLGIPLIILLQLGGYAFHRLNPDFI